MMIQLEEAMLYRTSVILRRGFIQDRRGMVSPEENCLPSIAPATAKNPSIGLA
jgi:hypothetical protein